MRSARFFLPDHSEDYANTMNKRNFPARTLERALERLTLASSFLALTGCTAMTGLDASNTFSCPAEPGVACSSLSETYDASLEHALPYQMRDARIAEAKAKQAAQGIEAPAAAAPDGTDPEHSDKALRNDTAADTGFVRSGFAASSPGEVPKAAKAAMDAAKQRAASERAAQVPARQSTESLASAALNIEAFAMPRRMPEMLVRIWIAPWTDMDGDLHDASYVYTRIREARWATAAARKPETGPALVPLPFGRLGEVPNDSARTGAASTSSNPSPAANDRAADAEYGNGARSLEDAKAALGAAAAGGMRNTANATSGFEAFTDFSRFHAVKPLDGAAPKEPVR